MLLKDKVPLTSSLADAMYSVGDVVDIPGTGITITVLAGTGGADFDIRIAYAPPATDYNVFIRRGDTVGGQFYGYLSPDVWVDSPKNGFNLGAGPPPHDQRDKPVAGQINRLYARVHNAGPGIAYDFDVRFRISEPYHTVGGEADFDQFVGIKHVPSLNVGFTDVFVEWTPRTAAEPHACLMVDLINLVGTDTNPNDNWAQENLEIVASVTSSPFHPVTHSYNLTNPYDRPALFYFRAEAPRDWNVLLEPRKIRLQPGERMVGRATVTPPEDARVCTSERVQITSWTPRGDTLINVGGTVLQVDLRRPTAIRLEAEAGRCTEKDLQQLFANQKQNRKVAEDNRDRDRKRCGRMTVHGCMDPPRPGQQIVLKYVDPLGNVTYRTVITDKNGCFDDIFVSASGGTWQVSAEYLGGKCEAPKVEGPIAVCWCH